MKNCETIASRQNSAVFILTPKKTKVGKLILVEVAKKNVKKRQQLLRLQGADYAVTQNYELVKLACRNTLFHLIQI